MCRRSRRVAATPELTLVTGRPWVRPESASSGPRSRRDVWTRRACPGHRAAITTDPQLPADPCEESVCWNRSDADTSLVPAGVEPSLLTLRCHAATHGQPTWTTREHTTPRHTPQGAIVHLMTAPRQADRHPTRRSSRAVDIHIPCGTFATEGGHVAESQAWRFTRNLEGDQSRQAARVSRRPTRERHHDAHEVRSTEGGERSQRPDRHPATSRRECRVLWSHRSAMDSSATRCWLSVCGT